MWPTKLPINSSPISTSKDMVSDIGCLNDIDSGRLKVGVQPSIQVYLSSQEESEQGVYILCFSYLEDFLSKVTKKESTKKRGLERSKDKNSTCISAVGRPSTAVRQG